jgi:RNA polymerase sigma-70 factor (ECF subfamily)
LEENYLINGIKTRNKIIFDFVFHYYYSGLCAYAERFVNDDSLAEDIVQDLFVTLWLKSKTIQINTSLKNYLFTAVKNRSLDHLKKEKTKEKGKQYISYTKKPAENLSVYWFAESELKELIDKCLESLPPRCREIIVMSRFEGLKNQEIADKLGISKRTVELQISNALKQLRGDLKDYLPSILLATFFI